MGFIVNWSPNGSHNMIRGGGSFISFSAPAAEPTALTLLALVTRETQTDDGYLITALEPAWLEISDLVSRNPNALFDLTPEQLEELVAASYDKAGFDEVTLTPRSGDHGRDVIAVKHGWGSIRILDQVKRYGPNNPVAADDIRALLGVLSADRNASKGIVTTTSTFAPRIGQDPSIAPFMPHRLELVDGAQLVNRIKQLNAAAKK